MLCLMKRRHLPFLGNCLGCTQVPATCKTTSSSDGFCLFVVQILPFLLPRVVFWRAHTPLWKLILFWMKKYFKVDHFHITPTHFHFFRLFVFSFSSFLYFQELKFTNIELLSMAFKSLVLFLVKRNMDWSELTRVRAPARTEDVWSVRSAD